MTYWDQFQPIDSPKAQQSAEQVPVLESQQPQIQSAQASQSIQSPEPQQDFWGQFQKIEAPENMAESFGRQAIGGLSRAFAQGLGLPGDIESLGRTLISRNQKGKGGLLGKISEKTILPTSSELLEMRKKAHPELEPKDRQEAITQEILGDYITAPGGILKKLAISAASVFAKEGAKDLGAGEKIQAGAKIITGILASRAGKPNVKDFIKKEYEQAIRAIPKNATIPGKRAESYLKQVKDKVNQGGHAVWKNDVNSQINALEKSIQNGQIKVTGLDQAIKDINSQLMEKSVRGTQAEMWLTRIKQAAQHELKQYGKTNPEFLKHYKDANASFAGYKQSIIAQRMIDKFKESGLLKGSVGLATQVLFKPELVLPAAGTLLGTYGVKKASELTARIFSNPTLANYYMKATAAAAKENAPQFIANISKLDQELKKYSKNQS